MLVRGATPRASAWATTCSMTPPMCSTSRRVPWNAEFAVTDPSTSQIGVSAALAGRLGALDHERRRRPCRGSSRGGAGRTAAPRPRPPRRWRPRPRRGSPRRASRSIVSEVASSAATITTRRQRPARIQSSASGDGLRRARARGVDLRVRPARADQLGELRVAHREHPEQEAAVERVGAPPRSAARRRGCGARPRRAPRRRCRSWSSMRVAQRLERGQALAAHVVGRLASDLVGHLLEAREGRGEDHPGVVAQLVGQRPAVGQLRARGRRLVAQDERDAGVAQRVDARRRSRAGCRARARPARSASTPNSSARSNAPARRRELDDVVGLVDRLEAAPPSSPLTSRVMCLSSISLAHAARG